MDSTHIKMISHDLLIQIVLINQRHEVKVETNLEKPIMKFIYSSVHKNIPTSPFSCVLNKCG